MAEPSGSDATPARIDGLDGLEGESHTDEHESHDRGHAISTHQQSSSHDDHESTSSRPPPLTAHVDISAEDVSPPREVKHMSEPATPTHKGRQRGRSHSQPATVQENKVFGTQAAPSHLPTVLSDAQPASTLASSDTTATTAGAAAQQRLDQRHTSDNSEQLLSPAEADGWAGRRRTRSDASRHDRAKADPDNQPREQRAGSDHGTPPMQRRESSAHAGPLFSGKPQQTPSRHRYTPRGRSPVHDHVTSPGSRNMSMSRQTSGSIESDRLEISQFMKGITCYDIMPKSTKMVVFDTQLKVKKAFFALVQNGIRSAPLWNSTLQQFVGMITITDFIRILAKYYRSPAERMDELEEHRIQTWRDMCRSNRPDTLISIGPLTSLYDAARFLVQEKIHRLPVINSSTGNALSILTHKRILLVLYANLLANARFSILNVTVAEAGIGTRRDMVTLTPRARLIECIDVFERHRVSAIPIVEYNGTVVDIYAKHDVINLARERTYNNLEVPVQQALEHRQDFEGVVTCKLNSSIREVIDSIVKRNVHRLVIVDDEHKLEGVVSLSDILGFLLGVETSTAASMAEAQNTSVGDNGVVHQIV